jgi:peptide/nickel transport system permease protein
VTIASDSPSAAAELGSPLSLAVAPAPVRSKRTSGRFRIVACLVIVGTYAIAAVVGPWIMDFDPVQTRTSMRLEPPFSRLEDGSFALFGTDQVGQDVFAQMLLGARISLLVGGATLVLAGLLGVTMGMLAGYFGGWSDSVLMRVADIQLTFPSILLAIFIAAVLGPSVVNVILVLAISNWVTFARVNRSQVLSLKHREYVDAARTLGAGHRHLMLRTVLPGCLAPILVVATVELGHVILAEASLSFLGLGVPTSQPSWGTTISNGRNYLADAWWISTIPGIALAILVLTTGVLGDALRDHYDPRLRSAG